jgi:hypothetical protein
MIPFDVPYNSCMKEVKLPIYSVWTYAQITFGKTMLRDPERLSLGYLNPFKSASKVPTSLANEDEWNALIQHVRTHLDAENAKNRGKGGANKPWCITLVDLKGSASSKTTKVSIVHAQGYSLMQLLSVDQPEEYQTCEDRIR